MGGGGGGPVSLAAVLAAATAGGGTGTGGGPGLIGSTLGAGGSGALEYSNRLLNPPSGGASLTFARRSRWILGSTLLTSRSSLTFMVGRKSSMLKFPPPPALGARRCGVETTGSAFPGCFSAGTAPGGVADADTVGLSERFWNQ